MPLEPSRLRVSLTSGMVGSSMPLMNCMPLAMHTVLGAAARAGRAAGRARGNATPPALCAADGDPGTDASFPAGLGLVLYKEQPAQDAARPPLLLASALAATSRTAPAASCIFTVNIDGEMGGKAAAQAGLRVRVDSGGWISAMQMWPTRWAKREKCWS